ncbi:cell division protein FtsL [Prosthecomicrobium sp. N25]|uniref:cell division protein FtsL n=1 Tax=Prosthecomicrobium sp. N25 TaxID=3129254 RepID=UPI003077588A
MMRTINILLVGGMLAGAGYVYYLKYDAERATTHLAQLNRKIQQERETIATLKAEWSLLNQPRRLQEMTERYHTYLELEPLDPNQVATIDEIPFRSAVPAASADAAGARKDLKGVAAIKPIDITGTVKKTGERLTGKTDKPAEPKGIDPRPNDPLNSILR